MSNIFTKGYDGRYHYTCVWCQKEIICFNEKHCVTLIFNHLASHDVTLPLMTTCLQLIHESLANYLNNMLSSQMQQSQEVQ